MTTGKLKYKHRKAIYLLIACDQQEDEVAEYLGVSTNTIKGWMKRPEFIEALEVKFQQLEKHDAKYRAKHNKQIVSAIIGEIQRRIAEGSSLKRMKFESLVKVLQAMTYETRLDSGEATSSKKIEHSIIDELSKRYSQANSAPEKAKPALRLVEPPIKETANG